MSVHLAPGSSAAHGSILRPLATVVLWGLWSSELGGQTITGVVREDGVGRPLPGVEVLVEGTSRTAKTDEVGRYTLVRVEVGTYVLLFRSVGFAPLRMRVTVQTGDTIETNVTLVKSSVQELDPVEVKAAVPGPRGMGREAFDERRRLGFGKFIDSAEIRRAETRRPSDLLRGIPGLMMVRFRECDSPGSTRCGPAEDRAASSRGMTSMVQRQNKEYCWMTVMLDGNPLYLSGSSRPPPDFSRDFRVSDLESIEVYRSSAEVPTEYGGTSAQCGVILLWSRRG
jgi:hypothetical protein